MKSIREVKNIESEQIQGIHEQKQQLKELRQAKAEQKRKK